MKELWELYTAFFRIGGLTFGGGLAMLPMLRHELEVKKGWVTEEEMLDYYAVGQCTPGVIAVNVATFVGFKRKGIPGAIVSTLGVISPSLLIISCLAAFLDVLMNNQIVAHAIGGVKIVVCALMVNTVLTLAKKSVVSPICGGIAVIGFLMSVFTEIPSVLLVFLAGVFGVAVQWAGRMKS